MWNSGSVPYNHFGWFFAWPWVVPLHTCVFSIPIDPHRGMLHSSLSSLCAALSSLLPVPHDLQALSFISSTQGDKSPPPGFPLHAPWPGTLLPTVGWSSLRSHLICYPYPYKKTQRNHKWRLKNSLTEHQWTRGQIEATKSNSTGVLGKGEKKG